MKKHIAFASIVTCVLLTGCSTPTNIETPETQEEFVMPFETLEDEGTYTGEADVDYGEPVWVGNSNSHGNLTFGDSTGGNFRVIKSYGDYGYEEYDVQYDDTTGYKSTYIYIFPTYGQSIQEYKHASGLTMGLKYLENVQDNLYVANVVDNGLPGFDASLTQDEAYKKVMSALNIDVSEATGENDFKPTAPATEYITMKDSYITLAVDEAAMLQPNHIPDAYDSLVFDIDDPLIAELSYDGTIVGRKAGTTYIHVSTPDYMYATTVIVEVT